MLHLLKILDKATGYIFLASPSSQPTSSSSPSSSQPSHPHSHAHDHPPPPTPFQPAPDSRRFNGDALFSSISGPIPGSRDIGDVQERWVDQKEVYDAYEREEWRREGERAGGGAGKG